MRIINTGLVTVAKLAVALACTASLGAAASAQISNITTGKDADLTIGGVPQALGTPVPSPYYVSQPSSRYGAGYAAYSNVSGGSIFFEAGSMSAGHRNSSVSTVEVSFDVTNTDPAGTITSLQSTIFESTFGFHVSDFSAPFVRDGEFVEGCSGVVLPSCGIATEGPGFSGFTAFGDATPPQELAYAGFKFEILQDGATVNEVSGSLTMVNTGGVISFLAGAGNASLPGQLNDFGLEEDNNYAHIFGWDRTNFSADLLNPLGLNESSTITYRITTETWNRATAFGAPTNNMIIAFACFADPLGRGGTRMAAIIPLGDPSDDTCDDFGELGGESPKVYTLNVPTVKDGQIVFTAPGVPEPDTWAMLIAGFGLVGLSMRRRRPAAATVTA